MRSCATGADEFVANSPRKWQICKGTMQMPQLSMTETEFNAAEAMVVRRDPLPTFNGPTHRFDCCVFCHTFPVSLPSYGTSRAHHLHGTVPNEYLTSGVCAAVTGGLDR